MSTTTRVGSGEQTSSTYAIDLRTTADIESAELRREHWLGGTERAGTDRMVYRSRGATR